MDKDEWNTPFYFFDNSPRPAERKVARGGGVYGESFIPPFDRGRREGFRKVFSAQSDIF